MTGYKKESSFRPQRCEVEKSPDFREISIDSANSVGMFRLRCASLNMTGFFWGFAWDGANSGGMSRLSYAPLDMTVKSGYSALNMTVFFGYYLHNQ